DELGAERAFVSTVAIHPFDEKHAAIIEAIGAPRICPAGKVQEPAVFWHHDGMPPLASLVRWRDLG
ncbi:MAG TPA: acyl-CoA reductase, partial [Luteolibacter sp.]|nr:acyl-CoA reductase [Luteolibacter sp.]